jgi:hypothetical protein
MLYLRSIFAGNGILAGLFAAVVAFVAWSWGQRQIGASTASAKLEARNAQSVARAHRAARKSADPDAAGVRDPYIRSD